MAELTRLEINKVRGANWPTTTVRRFAVDYDSGNDANLGYSDVDLATAGAVAKKTWEGLLDILPKEGNGRMFEVAIKQRAGGVAYRNAANTADAVLDYTDFSGYSRWGIRGTVTDTTASSVAFAGDANDHIMMGFRRSTGTNTAGYRITKETATIVGATNAAPVEVEHDGTVTFTSGQAVQISGALDALGLFCYINTTWTITVIDSTHFELDGTNTSSDGTAFPDMSACGGTVTIWKVVKADGSAAAIPTETTSFGWRWRGDIANTTVANRNTVFLPQKLTTSTIVPGPSIVDPTNDFWYIEEPGVGFSNVVVSTSINEAANPLNLGQVGGIRVTASGTQLFNFLGVGQVTSIVGCQGRSPRWQRCAALQVSPTWITIDTSPVARSIGIGYKNLGGSLLLTDLENFTATSFVSAQHTVLEDVRNITFLDSILSTISFFTIKRPLFLTVSNSRFRNQISVDLGFTARIPISIELNDSFMDGGNSEAIRAYCDNGKFLLHNFHDTRSFSQTGFYIVGRNNIVNLSAFGPPSTYLRGDSTSFVGGGGVVVDNNGSATPSWNTFDSLYGEIRDEANNVFYPTAEENFNTSSTYVVAIPTPNIYFNDTTAPFIERFQIARATGTGAFQPRIVDCALADASTAANASGTLVLATSRCDDGTVNGELSAGFRGQTEGVQWVRSDDLPAATGDIVYLSTSTPGNAQVAVPTLSGTNQKRRLGHAMTWRTTGGVNYILTSFEPEMLSVPADNLP